jgi:hypothetical protein
VGFASLHLIFFSRQRMHGVPLTGTGDGGGEGSLIGAFFRDLVGDAACFDFFPFLVDGFRPFSGEAGAPFFLRFFLAEDFGASGEVDMSMSGSRNSSSTTISSFLLDFLFRFFFSLVASGVAVAPSSVASAGRLMLQLVAVLTRADRMRYMMGLSMKHTFRHSREWYEWDCACTQRLQPLA